MTHGAYSPCDYCDGNHWFYSTPELGPCVCCTPDALTAAETAGRYAREAATKAVAMVETAEQELMLTRGRAALEAQYAKTAASEADDYWEAIEAAKSHLADYLVSIGQNAHPVTLPGPLGRLRDAINDVVGWR